MTPCGLSTTDSGRMRILTVARIEEIAKAQRLRQRRACCRRADQITPAPDVGRGMSGGIAALRRGGIRGGLARVDADNDQVEVAAGRETAARDARRGDPQNGAAEHVTGIVRHDEQGRPIAHDLAQSDAASIAVGERKFKGGVASPRVPGDLGQVCGGQGGFRRAERRQTGQQRRDADAEPIYGAAFEGCAAGGKGSSAEAPRAAMICIALATGMRRSPWPLSTHE